MWKNAPEYASYTFVDRFKEPAVKKQLVVIKSKWKSTIICNCNWNRTVERHLNQHVISHSFSPYQLYRIKTTIESICFFFMDYLYAKDSMVWHCCFSVYGFCFCLVTHTNNRHCLVEAPVWSQFLLDRHLIRCETVDWNFNCTFQLSFVRKLLSVSLWL